MSAPLEQYLYGWAEAGLEGRNRLQIVATSPGWREEDRYRRVAQRLARLEADGDRDPIAFGWADLGGRRFVFQRRLVPSPTGDARRLVAHVVAGAPEELPVGLVLRAFDSSFWWSGEPRDPVCPTACPADLAASWSEADRPAASAAADALLGHVLATPAGVPTTFDGSPRETHAALWTIGERLPTLLETLSCSTYETGQMVGWFDVAGLDGRARPRGASWASHNAVDPRYAPAELDDLGVVVEAAVRDRSAIEAKERPAVYREVLRVAARVVARQADGVQTLMTRPQTLPLVLATDIGADGVAVAMWGSSAAPWPPLPAELPVARPRLDDLAVRTADAADVLAVATVGTVARRLQTLDPALGPLYVERLLQRRAAGHTLPVPELGFLAAAMAWAYETHPDESLLRALMTWVDEQLTGALVADRRVPAAWRPHLFDEAARRHLLQAEDYRDLIIAHPDLFDGDWLPRDASILASLITSDIAAVRGVTADAITAEGTTGETVALAFGLRRQGRSLGGAALLEAVGRTAKPRFDRADSDAIWQLLEALAVDASVGAGSVGLDQVPWHLTPRLGPVDGWIDLVADLMTEPVATRLAAWPGVLDDVAPAQRRVAGRVALHDVVLGGASDADVRRLLAGIDAAALPPADRVAATLSALERRPDGAPPLPSAVLFAVRSALVRTGLLRLGVSAGESADRLRAAVRRLLAAEPDAFSRVRPDWLSAWWLRTNGLRRG
ncbi:MAG: hypothetical protein QM572_00465 [Nocardioides sp.]|uniref:hypothetical protein n=1 Tax=Nocardioides sp. TaxID=35761 RepID=UPI0039E59DBB